VREELAWIALHDRGQTHLIRETMGSLEARLDPAHFERVHRSAIVNLRKVRELVRAAAGSLVVVLHDGTSLEVSRSRRRQLSLRLAGRR
jgi:two-component system LytT family response regulator